MNGYQAAVLALAVAAFVPGQARSADPNAQKQQLIQQQDAELGGTVKQVSGTTVTIEPYNPSANIRSFSVSPDTPVFQGGGQITPKGLQPGVDVLMHFKNPKGSQPAQALAVDVLDQKQAQALKQQSSAQAGAAPKEGAQVRQQRQQIVDKAGGSQPGKVVDSSQGFLVIDPYQEAAGEAKLSLSPDTPVFQGGSQVSVGALQPGVDVRVFYDEKQTNVVAVDVLTPEEAKTEQQALQKAPRRNE